MSKKIEIKTSNVDSLGSNESVFIRPNAQLGPSAYIYSGGLNSAESFSPGTQFNIGSDEADTIPVVQTHALSLGVAGAGQVSLNPDPSTATYPLQLPAAQGAATQYLANDGTGVLSWTSPSSGGVSTVGAFSGSSEPNGAAISGSTITFGPADGTNPGMVTTGAQTFAGTKTFSDIISPLFQGLDGTAGSAATVRAGNGSAGNGAALSLSGGNSASAGNGGALTLTGGTTASGLGGAFTLTAGATIAGTAPASSITGSSSATSSAAGQLSVTAGGNSSTGVAGTLVLQGGASTSGAGGSATIKGGNGGNVPAAK